MSVITASSSTSSRAKNATGVAELYSILASQQFIYAGEFQKFVNLAVESQKLDGSKAAELFDIDPSMLERWRKAESCPHPYARPGVIDHIAKKTGLIPK